MTEQFEAVRKQVSWLAHKAARRSPLDYDEAFAEACLHAVKAIQSHRAERGALSTVVQHYVHNGLVDYGRKESTQHKQRCPALLDGIPDARAPRVDLSELSPTARRLVDTLTDPPPPIAERTSRHPGGRTRVWQLFHAAVDFLLADGVPAGELVTAFGEIREALCS